MDGWKGEEEQLNKSAFKMYGEFKPDVSKGQKGRDKKGALRSPTVCSVVRKG